MVQSLHVLIYGRGIDLLSVPDYVDYATYNESILCLRTLARPASRGKLYSLRTKWRGELWLLDNKIRNRRRYRRLPAGNSSR